MRADVIEAVSWPQVSYDICLDCWFRATGEVRAFEIRVHL
jgi:hypothetical protein